jgi:hypothetical protein
MCRVLFLLLALVLDRYVSYVSSALNVGTSLSSHRRSVLPPLTHSEFLTAEETLDNLKLYNPLLPYGEKLVPLQEVPADYTYSPPEVGADIYIGSAVAVMPIVWGAVEFWKRVKTQQECLLCSGSGLVYSTRSGGKLTRPRKCWSCGGFIPWLGWKMFFLGSFTDMGNGGVLQRPAADYKDINKRIQDGTLDPGSAMNSKKEVIDDDENK